MGEPPLHGGVGFMSSDMTNGGASTTAVQSLLRTLDDAARWDGRPASRVRAFAPAPPTWLTDESWFAIRSADAENESVEDWFDRWFRA